MQCFRLSRAPFRCAFLTPLVESHLRASGRIQGPTANAVQEAADHALKKELVELGGSGGAIALDKNGNFATPYTENGMYRGWVRADGVIEVRSSVIPAHGITTPFKVGTSLRRGWTAHWRDGVLLVKRAGHDESQEYADMGASGQVYSHPTFTELETLGPLMML